MLFFYVRHGDPIYNPDSLTDLGKKQAEALVARMERCAPDRIFASSSTRAIMTATPTAQKLQKEIEILDWCHEDYAGRDLAHFHEDGSWHCWGFQHPETKRVFASEEIRKLDRNWHEHPYVKACGISGTGRIQQNTDALFASLGYRHDLEKNGYWAERPNNDRIALFAHQGFGIAFLSSVLDIPYPMMCTHFDHGHSGMSVILFEGDDFVIPRVLQLSNDSHLFAAGIDTVYQNILSF